MADYRRHYEDAPRRHDREWSDRAADEVRSWFGDDDARRRRHVDDRDDRYGYGSDRSPRHEPSDRGSRWEGAPDDRASYGMYRTDDRDYHDRYRGDGRYTGDRERGERSSTAAAGDYYRAARDQREDYLRWSARNMGTWGEQHLPSRDDDAPTWGPRERGGYWRHYEASRPHHVGRGPKGYQRSDDRIRDEICDCMTDDPVLDASDIEVDVKQGEVTLRGTVTSRDQKRRAEDVAERISGVRDVTNQLRVSREGHGHNWTESSKGAAQELPASHTVTQAAGNGTTGKSTSGNTA
jgi:osmotically-inducible protein OsmY